MGKLPNGIISGVVTQRIDWTERLFTLQVKAPIKPYVAGQFTKLALFDQNGDLIRRAYSIVNHPEHALGFQTMDFLIIADDDGQLSPMLNALNINDEIFVGENPSGFMTLKEIPTDKKDLWLLSTGTAIGPFLAILDTPELNKRFENLVLVHAVRKESELVYGEQIEHLKKKFNGQLRFIPIVSRECVDGTLQGRIPQLLTESILQQHANCPLDKERSFIYMCGNPDMVKDTSTALKGLGFEKHLRRKPGQFSSENYW